MPYLGEKCVQLPGCGERIALALPPDLKKLRDAALERQRTGVHGVSTHPLSDAQAWRERGEGEDWLIWRARRTRQRLRTMSVDISPGERIVGRPELSAPTDQEAEQMEQIREILEEIPSFPGGDSGHFHPDYETLFHLGIGGILEEIQERAQGADTKKKRAFYEACDMALEGVSDYAERVAEACERLAEDREDDLAEREKWREIAEMCRRISTEPPSTFHEAIQLMFLVLIALWFGEDHYLTTPGRMDQTLRRFYEADVMAGILTPQDAMELISCLYIQLNMILGAGSAESVMVGGRDPEGRDATCELTYLCLVARMVSKLVYPTVGLAWHEGTPSELTEFCCQMLSTGIGDPAFFNDELIVQGLREHGVSDQDSYNYMNSTCVEIKVVGASNMWVTAPYFNCPKALLEVMESVREGSLLEPASFTQLKERVRERLASTVKEAAKGLHQVWQRRGETGCFPLASCLIKDCLEKGEDFDRGGARYNWVENSFVGLANLVDGLVAIKRLVYEEKELSLGEFSKILESNYQENETLRQRILNQLPSYGNDEEESDALAVEWAEFLEETTQGNIVGLHPYVPGFFCWVIHERFGADTGATPDGRVAGFPLADGAGAAQGREKTGPTASVRSTTKWNHKRALGGLVQNVRFSKSALRDKKGLDALRGLIETYLRLGGFEMQLNVVSADTLRDAQECPEEYSDLLVRVAGYSDYFTHLNPNMQAEVIARTEHSLI